MSFCVECGNRLPDVAKFCPECGTKVAAPAAEAAPPAEAPLPLPPELRQKFDAVRSELQGERREVVVLFADLKGYTSMSEKLDAEEVTFLMNRLLRDLAGAVYEYEGYVDKFIGDAVMALFGAPLAHEDDPERGVLAGLRMLEVVREENARSEFDLSLRVGINLGEVIAAHLGSQMSLQYTVIGDTVNVASRLEGAAEPNTVLVSEAVWNRVQRRFEGVELPPMTLKGKAEPIRGWRVEGLRAERRRREQTPFVGREDELARLTSTFERAASGASAAILLEAEAGVGKTRLVREAVARAPVGTRVVELQFSPIRIPGQRAPEVEIFEQLADDAAEATALLGSEAARHAQGLHGLASEADPETAGGPVPEDLDPAAARQNRWLATAALLRARAGQGPVALVLEDLNWAGEADREFLAFLLGQLANAPLVAYLTARRIDLDWLPESVERMPLAPLDAEAAAALLGSLLDELPPEERRELIRRSAGNPLFLEELARALSEVGGSGRAVPSMLQGLMMSRIDRLDAPLQHLLQMAAVLGVRFPLPLLSSMFRIDSQPILFDAALTELEERGFVTVEGEQGSFLSALMQEVAYGGLLIRVRRVLHESAARLGEESFERRETEAAFFAHHYWHADLPHEAAPHLWIAGRAAAAAWDLPAAETFLRRAAEALAKSDRTLDPEEAARFDETLGSVLLHRGAMEEATEWFRRLEERGRSDQRREWEARGIEHQGRIAWYRGRLDEAQELFERGLEIVPPDARTVTADLNNDLGIVHYYRHDLDRSYDFHSRALELRREIDDRLGIAKSFSNMGNVLLHLKRDYEEAESSYRQALEVAIEISDRQMQYSALNNLGLLTITRGQWSQALETLDQAMAILAEIGWSYARFVTLQNRAWCELETGRFGDALRHLELCREKGEEMLEPVNRLATRRLLFDLWMHVGDSDRAEAMLEEMRVMVDQLELGAEAQEVRISEARWLTRNGRWEDAARAFLQIEEAAEPDGEVELLARAQGCRARARAGMPETKPCDPDLARGNEPLGLLVRYLLADAATVQESSAAVAAELSAVADRAAALLMAPLELAAATRLGDAHQAMGDVESARAAYERAASVADALGASLPEEHRTTFEARADIAGLRQRLAPA